jgi:hypothetical protein
MDLNNLRYQDVERALKAFHWIGHNDQKAFRARIRHLRNLGVPSIEKVGKGTQVTYTRKHLWELHIALELTKSGVSPAIAATATKIIGDHIPEMQVEFDCNANRRTVLVFWLEEFGSHSEGTSIGIKAMTSDRYCDDISAGRLGRSHIVIELSANIRATENALLHGWGVV